MVHLPWFYMCLFIFCSFWFRIRRTGMTRQWQLLFKNFNLRIILYRRYSDVQFVQIKFFCNSVYSCFFVYLRYISYPFVDLFVCLSDKHFLHNCLTYYSIELLQLIWAAWQWLFVKRGNFMIRRMPVFYFSLLC